INRKIAKSIAGNSEEQAWCYRVLNEQTPGTETGLKVLIARIRNDLLQEIHQALALHGIRPRAVTLALEGVIHLMQFMVPEEGDVSSILALDISSRETMLSEFRGGRLQQIRSLKAGGLTGNDKFTPMLREEIRRSQTYHKEKYKGRCIETAILLGSHADNRVWDDNAFSLDFAIDTDLHFSGKGLPQESGTETSNFTGLARLMTGLLFSHIPGLRARERSDLGINFATPIRRTGYILASLATLCLALFAILYSFAGNRQEENLCRARYADQLSAEIGQLNRISARHNQLLALNGYMAELQGFYNALIDDRSSIAESALLVCDILPPDFSLKSLTYARESKGGESSAARSKLRFKLEGSFVGRRHSRLMQAIDPLRATGQIEQITLNDNGTNLTAGSGKDLHETIDMELILK
ncbi:MAG: hypothetical protein ABIK28_25345, partial [Planctomycetota bacterium]